MDTPWVAKEYPADDVWHIHTPDGGWLASVHIDGEPELARKQARLIAAAPEMYDGIVEFCRRVEAGEIRSIKTYNAFKAIIAKATQP